jgi:hypothetical protein
VPAIFTASLIWIADESEDAMELISISLGTEVR